MSGKKKLVSLYILFILHIYICEVENWIKIIVCLEELNFNTHKNYKKMLFFALQYIVTIL